MDEGKLLGLILLLGAPPAVRLAFKYGRVVGSAAVVLCAVLVFLSLKSAANDFWTMLSIDPALVTAFLVSATIATWLIESPVKSVTSHGTAEPTKARLLNCVVLKRGRLSIDLGMVLCILAVGAMLIIGVRLYFEARRIDSIKNEYNKLSSYSIEYGVVRGVDVSEWRATVATYFGRDSVTQLINTPVSKYLDSYYGNDLVGPMDIWLASVRNIGDSDMTNLQIHTSVSKSYGSPTSLTLLVQRLLPSHRAIIPLWVCTWQNPTVQWDWFRAPPGTGTNSPRALWDSKDLSLLTINSLTYGTSDSPAPVDVRVSTVPDDCDRKD